MTNQHIGQIFDKPIHVNLIPHRILAPGYFRVRIDWISESGPNETSFNSTEWNASLKNDLNIVVGNDVHMITFLVERHNSFPSGPRVRFHQTMRVDRLILLNLACKLLNKTI